MAVKVAAAIETRRSRRASDDGECQGPGHAEPDRITGKPTAPEIARHHDDHPCERHEDRDQRSPRQPLAQPDPSEQRRDRLVVSDSA
jgi:hypothetical protein